MPVPIQVNTIVEAVYSIHEFTYDARRNAALTKDGLRLLQKEEDYLVTYGIYKTTSSTTAR